MEGHIGDLGDPGNTASAGDTRVHFTVLCFIDTRIHFYVCVCINTYEIFHGQELWIV